MYGVDEIDTRCKENIRDKGEVFTPFKIVDQMIALFPDTVWADPEFVIIEPTCGNGQFLVKIIEKRISSGIPIEAAFNTLIGMDISKENINESHLRLFAIAANEMGKTGIKPNTEEWFEKAMRIVVIVRNNIFLVKDSLKVISDYGIGKGVLCKKKFVFNDPCGGVAMSKTETAELTEHVLNDFEDRDQLLKNFFVEE